MYYHHWVPPRWYDGPVGLDIKELDADLAAAGGRLQHEFLRHLTDVLDSHYRKLHDGLSDSWSDVDERRFIDTGTQLQLQPQTENHFRVDFILAVAGVAAGQAAMLELGAGDGHKILFLPSPPAGPGLATLNLSTRIRLSNTDPRFLSVVTLTGSTVPGNRGSGTAGFLYLALMGKEIPPGAVRW